MSGDTAMKHGQCMTDETLTGYLEDVLEPVVKAACEVHLIACDRCRGHLAMYMRVLRTETTPDEDGALKAISDAWANRKGGTLPPREQRAGRRRSFFMLWAGVAALAVVVLVSVRISLNRPRTAQSAGEVVQLLLSQSRPFEARLSGQPHLPLVQTRSGNASSIDYGLIASEMSRLSAGAYDMGRFYLLQQEFDLAIRSFEIAVQDPASRPEVHNDLGVAYMERGGDVNLQKAADQFLRALDRNANDPPAVFNLSLVYERMGAVLDAEMQWKRYLELDSTSGWASEIRSKLGNLSR